MYSLVCDKCGAKRLTQMRQTMPGEWIAVTGLNPHSSEAGGILIPESFRETHLCSKACFKQWAERKIKEID